MGGGRGWSASGGRGLWAAEPPPWQMQTPRGAPFGGASVEAARRPESATREYEYPLHTPSSPHPLSPAPSSQAGEEPCGLWGPEFRDHQPSVGLGLEEAGKSRPCSFVA